MPRGPEFSNSEIKQFAEPARHIIRLAQELDWRVNWANATRHLLILQAPDRYSINMPKGNIRSSRIASYINALWHHSDRGKWLTLLRGNKDMLTDPELARIVAVAGTTIAATLSEARETQKEREMTEQQTVAPPKDDAWATAPTSEAPAQEVADQEEWIRPNFEYDRHEADWYTRLKGGIVEWECRAHHTPFRTTDARKRANHQRMHHPNALTGHELAALGLGGRRAKQVVKTEEWRAGLRGRISPTSVKQTHGDGTVDYKCKGCRYTSENPRSVAAHWRMSHAPRPTGISQPKKEQMTDAPKASALAKDSSSDKILAAVRALVGGQDQQEVEDLNLRIEILERDKAALMQQRNAAVKRATDAEGDLDALRSLLNKK